DRLVGMRPQPAGGRVARPPPPTVERPRQTNKGGADMSLLKSCRLALAAFALIGLAFVATPAPAQQPNQVNPTASAVKEDQLLNQMKILNGRGSIPDVKSYNLEQPAGREWREFRETALPWVGAISILGILVVLVLFYLIRGMVRIEGGRSGR